MIGGKHYFAVERKKHSMTQDRIAYSYKDLNNMTFIVSLVRKTVYFCFGLKLVARESRFMP